MIYKVNLLQSFLLILYSFIKKKYYLQVYLDNFTDKIPNKKMAHYFNKNLFDVD